MEDRKLHRGFWWTAEGKRALVRPRRRWEYNIKMDLQEDGWEMDCISVFQDRDRRWALVNAVTNISGLENVEDFLITREQVSVSGSTLFHGVS
jgi:hypothetical protein